MTLTLINAGKYLAFFLLLAWVYFTRGELFIIKFSLPAAFLLVWAYVTKKLRLGFLAAVTYFFILMGTMNYLNVIFYYDYLFLIFIPFLPLLLIHYLNNSPKKIPGGAAIAVMISGLFLTVAYQTIINRGVNFIDQTYEGTIIKSYVFYLSLCMLLTLRAVSLWKTLLAAVLSILPEILYVYFRYASRGMIGEVFNERLGSSVDFSANQLSVWLDLAFPVALFIALYDNRRRYRVFFAAVATLYGASLLLTQTRGSFIGIIFIICYLIVKTKTRFYKYSILAISLMTFIIFGRGAIERVVAPTATDMLSAYGRAALYKSAKNIVKANHVVFGIGMNNFIHEKFKYGFPTSCDYRHRMSSHNGFLDFWLGWGIFGLIGFVMFLVQSIISIWRARLRPEMHYLKPALTLAILCSSIHFLFDSPINNFSWQIIFLSIIACGFYLGQCDNVQSSSSDDGAVSGGVQPLCAVSS